jgi:thiol-disulfide isomerase/thioredoxin
MSAYHFWSDICPPCNRLKPVFQDLKEDYPKLKWISVDIKNDPNNYHKQFSVTQVPTLVCVSSDGTITKHSGSDAIGYFKLVREVS